MKNSVWNAFVKYDEGVGGAPGFADRCVCVCVCVCMYLH
jgi:hypothetical protein